MPDASREYAGSSLLDLGRGLLVARGRRSWLGTADVASTLLGRTGGMHSTSDFALLAGTSANRALLDRFQQLAPALLPIAKKQTVPDYRSINRIRFGEGSDLTMVAEHGEVTRGVVRERGESYAVATFAKIFAFTRKLIVNDDLGAFKQFISEIGGNATVILGNTLFDVLNNNALMSDGIALFATTHGNLAGTPATIDATSLNLARVAMRAQVGVDGGLIGVAPKFLICGAAKETAAEVMLASLAPTSTSDVNPFAGRLTLIVEPRISGNAWYLAADPSVMHGLEFAELDGSRSMGGTGPQIETMVGFDVKRLEVKVTYDVGAGAVAYQPLWKNAGA